MSVLPLLPLVVASIQVASVQVPAAAPPASPGDVKRQAPYDFAPAEQLLQSELPNLQGRAAVIVRQGGREVFCFQAGSIDFETKTRVASFTKTVSAGVILDLVETGHLALDERIGDAYPLYQSRGIGDSTVLDCWSMRHGLETQVAYHRSPLYTHGLSVYQIGTQGSQVFTPGTMLGYDGVAMQVSGYIGVQRTGLRWEDLATARLLAPLGMQNTDYGQFAPNPAVAGGMRTSADDVMRYLQMVMDGGVFAGQRILDQASVDQLFVNHTSGLPVHATPFPASHPDYPYGVPPDYAFGGWVLAENPVSHHVEEIVGAGAWGSFLWLDRRRDLTAVFITDVPAGSQSSMDAALGVMTAARAAVEAKQASDLAAVPVGALVRLDWAAPADGTATRIFGSDSPIQDIFDLREAIYLDRTTRGSTILPRYLHYAALSELGSHLNTALVPGENVVALP